MCPVSQLKSAGLIPHLDHLFFSNRRRSSSLLSATTSHGLLSDTAGWPGQLSTDRRI